LPKSLPTNVLMLSGEIEIRYLVPQLNKAKYMGLPSGTLPKTSRIREHIQLQTPIIEGDGGKAPSKLRQTVIEGVLDQREREIERKLRKSSV